MRHPCRLLALLIGLVVFPRAEVRAQAKITSPDGFSFVVPAGYQPVERLRTVLPGTRYALATDSEDVRATALLVVEMEGAVRQGSDIVAEHLKMTPWAIGGGPRTEITERWKGLEIPAVRMTSRAKTPSGQMDVVTFDLIVPLRPVAWRVIVTGPEWDETPAHQALQSFLSSLDGDTNWERLTGPDGATKLQRSVEASGGVLGKLIVAVLVLLGAAWWVLRRVRA